MPLRKRWKRGARWIASRSRRGGRTRESRKSCNWRASRACQCGSRNAGSSTAWPIRKITREWWRWQQRAAATLEDILANANASAGQKGLIVLLDGVEDPHNLGAIVRTALAAGTHGVVIPERRAAGLTDTVARASAGAQARLPAANRPRLA